MFVATNFCKYCNGNLERESRRIKKRDRELIKPSTTSTHLWNEINDLRKRIEQLRIDLESGKLNRKAYTITML